MKIALLLILVFMPFTTAAAEWINIHTAADQSQFFYDSSKLFLHEDEITYWKKVTFKMPQPFKDKLIARGLYRERIHCAEHTLKLISYLLYTPEGEISEYTPVKEGDPAPIIPDSLGDIFEKSLCPLVQQKQEEMRQKAEIKAKTDVEEKVETRVEAEAVVIIPAQSVLPSPSMSVSQD